jgi:hypothetical protein
VDRVCVGQQRELIQATQLTYDHRDPGNNHSEALIDLIDERSIIALKIELLNQSVEYSHVVNPPCVEVVQAQRASAILGLETARAQGLDCCQLCREFVLYQYLADIEDDRRDPHSPTVTVQASNPRTKRAQRATACG